jgi:hypothetical protein
MISPWHRQRRSEVLVPNQADGVTGGGGSGTFSLAFTPRPLRL